MIDKVRMLKIKWNHLKHYCNEYTFRVNMSYPEFVIINAQAFNED
jgi:hypothetical protein